MNTSPKKEKYSPFKQALDNSPYFNKAFNKQFHNHQCRYCDSQASYFCFYCIDQDQMTASRALYCDNCGFKSPHIDEEFHKLIPINSSRTYTDRCREYIEYLIEMAESSHDTSFEEYKDFPIKQKRNSDIFNILSQLKKEFEDHPNNPGLLYDIKTICDDYASVSVFKTLLYKNQSISVEDRYRDIDFNTDNVEGLTANFKGIYEHYEAKKDKLETQEASLAEMINFYDFVLPDLKLMLTELEKSDIERVETMLLLLASSKRIGSYFLNKLPVTPAPYIMATEVEVSTEESTQ